MTLTRVKYPCLLSLLLFISGLSLAQNSGTSMNIRWQPTKKILDSLGLERSVLSFEKAVYSPEFNYLPAIAFSIPGNVTELKIENISTEALTTDELKTIPSTFDPATLRPHIKVVYHKGSPVSIIHLVPLKGDAGGISGKITSFEYSYQRTFSAASPSVNSGFPVARHRNGLRLASFANNSVLSSGEWHKIAIGKSGIFKIDYAFLKSMGFQPSEIEQINPKEIKIYGNGGGMLPQNITDFRNDDLVENAIYVEGENDGKFDEGDFILFYGKGPDTWSYSSTKKRFVHTKNLYSDKAYYFITIGPGNGLRIQGQASVPATATVNHFDEYFFYENDLYNLVNSGREWYGEAFDVVTDQSYSFPVTGIVPNTNLSIHASVIARSFAVSDFKIYLNNQLLGTRTLAALSNYQHAIRATTDSITFWRNTNLFPTGLSVRLNYDKKTYSSAIGHLNYLEINVKRSLELYGNETSFRSIESTNQSATEFLLNNATSQTKIWDVTDPLHPENLTYNLTGSLASFSTNTSVLKEFVAFSGSDFTSPSYIGSVMNQDLHSINTPDLPDLIIVTNPNFISAANRLASYRKSKDNLDVEVVTTDQVYNEFSSGAQDITAIRDFVKMLYNRKSGSDSIRYLLLFGDATYNYKNVNSANFQVPIYESRQSLHPVDSYSSDDYFGFLNDYSGEWIENGTVNDTLQIGIGRLPVKNTTEAEIVVNKIIHYESSPSSQGKWRNRLTFIADDGDTNLHLKDADFISDIVKANYKEYNINKIYLDAYPQISAPGGETCPQAKESITQAVDKGTLILNYTGHGGIAQLSQETLIDNLQINSWTNYNALTFFITATCEFGRYDDPNIVSGAEHSMLSDKGGAIALITSTRPVYSNSNKELNQAIYENIFIPLDGSMPRLGDVIRLTKNNSLFGINNRNYALLGDPSMMLAYPKQNIVITKINGNAVSLTDTLKALSTATIEGEVRDGVGAKISDFNGTVYLTVYDKESTIPTLGTQGSTSMTFKTMNNLIYEGPATVTNGGFSVSFVIPKDISYQFDKGKISVYALKNNALLDANGFNSDIIIGGSDPNFVADNTPPQIKLYMNDESFVFGGLTGKNSLFLAKVADDNGINIAGQGIGHEITATLDNTDNTLVLNEFYSAKKDNFKEGSVEYPFKNLNPGNHSIKFKCWDTHNNSSEAYLEFVVANDEKIALDHVLNYPNPFSTHTTFQFDHNRAGEDLDVMVQIYTVSGKLIKTLDNRYLSSPSHVADLAWDGRDDFGDKIGKGVYVYKVNLRSVRDGSTVFKYQKLVILN